MLQFYLNVIENEEEREKFETLYLTYRNIMLARAKQILRDQYLAEDAVHEAFIRIAKNINRIDVSNCHKLKSFLVVVVDNVSKTMYVKKKKENIIQYEEIIGPGQLGEDILDKIVTDFQAVEIADKIECLPEKYSQALMLRYIHGLSDKEISNILGLSHAATRKRLQRARVKLALLLEEGDTYEL